MSDFLIAVLITVSTSTWLYAKIQHRTMNSQTTMIATGVCGAIIFFVSYTIIGLAF